METIDQTTVFLTQLFDLYRLRYGHVEDVRAAVNLGNDDNYVYIQSWFFAFSAQGLYGYSTKDLKAVFSIVRKRGTYWFEVSRRVTISGKTIFPTRQMVRSIPELVAILTKLKLAITITKCDNLWEYDDGINLWRI